MSPMTSQPPRVNPARRTKSTRENPFSSIYTSAAGECNRTANGLGALAARTAARADGLDERFQRLAELTGCRRQRSTCPHDDADAAGQRAAADLQLAQRNWTN